MITAELAKLESRQYSWDAPDLDYLFRDIHPTKETRLFRLPNDGHLHLREGEVLASVLPHSAESVGYAIIEPNLKERPILTAKDALWYKGEITKLLPADSLFRPQMTIYLTSSTTAETIREAHDAGVEIVKVYPPLLTTNSELGVVNPLQCYGSLVEMQKRGMVLQIHPEVATRDFRDQERAYVPLLQAIHLVFPDLKISVEHITTIEMVEAVLSLPDNVGGSITGHHLFLTENDVLRGKIRPHYYCAPIAKRHCDRLALRMVALSGHPKFWLGSDSARHSRGAKECACGCAGIFTAPVLVSILLDLFGPERMSEFQRFTSSNLLDFYGWKPLDKKVIYENRPKPVPVEIDGAVPFLAKHNAAWQEAS